MSSETFRLTQVDKLEFLVLVDNCVEWFSRLPEGFSHELPQHLSRPKPNGPPVDELTGIPTLDLDNFCCGAHGLSIHLTTTIGDKSYQVLMDGGPEGLSIERNAKAMRIRLDELDGVTLSHWHRDHSGGILKALQLRSELAQSTLHPVTVDLHPERPLRRGIAPLPKRIPLACLPQDPTFEEIAHMHGKVELHDEFHEMRGRNGNVTGIGVSGEIPRKIEFEIGLPGAITWMIDEEGKGGWFTDELIKDERYVVVDVKGKGLVVFSSCSHAGICNVIIDAMTRFNRPIHIVVGGFHLVPAEQQPVKQTIDFIARRMQPRPKFVLPLHCTGLGPRGMLRDALGEACIPAGVGMKVVVEGDEAADDALDSVDVRISD